jgi:cutinase
LTAGLTLAVSATAVAVVAAATPAAGAVACADVDIVFARGTGEAAGLGIVGRPFVSSLTSALSGRTVTSYAVNYAANSSQTSAGPGATDMSNHISTVAAACPGTQFVIGGYSQGASVTDIAVGIRTGTSTGTPIPSALSGRVAAVVVFGNPLGISGRTIATASPVYGPKSRDYCASGDPVCGGGANFAAHLAYPSNGMTTQGAQFAAARIASTPAPSATTPAPSPTPTNPTPTTPVGTCVRDSTADHVSEGRAVERFDRVYAKGSNDYLGRENSFTYVSLRSTGTDAWSLVMRC